MATEILFITGTDTGVGKTVLTALLLSALRARGARALALKPFCSGARDDAELLHRLQDGDLSLDQINPFYFAEPVAPLASARRHRNHVPIQKVTRHIEAMLARLGGDLPSSASTRSYLLIEGSGGLLVPLGEGYTVLDLIVRLNCDVLLVSRNQLGTINHTLLSLRALRAALPRRSSLKTVLMDPPIPDFSTASNPAILREWTRPAPLVQLPFLGRNCLTSSAIKRAANRCRQRLAKLV